MSSPITTESLEGSYWPTSEGYEKLRGISGEQAGDFACLRHNLKLSGGRFSFFSLLLFDSSAGMRSGPASQVQVEHYCFRRRDREVPASARFSEHQCGPCSTSWTVKFSGRSHDRPVEMCSATVFSICSACVSLGRSTLCLSSTISLVTLPARLTSASAQATVGLSLAPDGPFRPKSSGSEKVSDVSGTGRCSCCSTSVFCSAPSVCVLIEYEAASTSCRPSLLTSCSDFVSKGKTILPSDLDKVTGGRYDPQDPHVSLPHYPILSQPRQRSLPGNEADREPWAGPPSCHTLSSSSSRQLGQHLTARASEGSRLCRRPGRSSLEGRVSSLPFSCSSHNPQPSCLSSSLPESLRRVPAHGQEEDRATDEDNGDRLASSFQPSMPWPEKIVK
eukprot:750581-Hanusia_phi.AAC.3